MPKVPVLTLPRPQPRTVTRTFTDPQRPEYPITMTLRALTDNPHAFLVAQDHAEAFRKDYETNWFPHPGGEAIEITETVAQTVCLLEAMQVGPPQEVYDRNEVLGILLSLPGAWVQIAQAVSELSEAPPKAEAAPAGGDSSPNSSRVPASTSCAPSATAVSGTPTSPSTPPGESTPSISS